jgi:thiamine monophosphate synthase
MMVFIYLTAVDEIYIGVGRISATRICANRKAMGFKGLRNHASDGAGNSAPGIAIHAGIDPSGVATGQFQPARSADKGIASTAAAPPYLGHVQSQSAAI